MALQTIRPEYKSWVESQTSIDEMLSNLQSDFEKLNKIILEGSETDLEITKKVDDVSSKLLYSSLVLKNKIYEDNEGDYSEQSKILEKLRSNMSSIDEYQNKQIMMSQKTDINILSWFAVVFLPLSLITGYYGMNFASMGNPIEEGATGVLAEKDADKWVFFLFAISLLITVILVKFFNRK